jgi:hypothetical protein
MSLGNNVLVRVVIGIISTISGWFNRGESNSLENVRNSNNVYTRGDNNVVLASVNNYPHDANDQAINSLANDFIDNHNRRRKESGDVSLMEQGYNMALELSSKVLGKDYDADNVPKLRTAYVCLQEEMRFTQAGIPHYIQVNKKNKEDLELMRAAYEKVMGVAPAPLEEGGGPGIRWLG